MPADDTATATATLKLVRQNISLVKKIYPGVTRLQLRTLKDLTRQSGFSCVNGDLIFLQNGWFVTHAGLLRLSQRQRCMSIDCTIEEKFSDAVAGRWVFRATLHKSQDQTFVGYGDADPSNVSALVRGAEMRVAETRAVNRALRKAYGIGICSVEEVGAVSMPAEPSPIPKMPSGKANRNGSAHNVRDRLCQIIRQHKLNPELVKAYAVDFCGTKALKDATREQVEQFVQQLAEAAMKDRQSLLCHLNSYARPNQEVVA
jgi:hypothetical protein